MSAMYFRVWQRQRTDSHEFVQRSAEVEPSFAIDPSECDDITALKTLLAQCICEYERPAAAPGTATATATAIIDNGMCNADSSGKLNIFVDVKHK
jgi:hypothetical protein